MDPEGSATGHLDSGFLRLPRLQVNDEVVTKFGVVIVCLSCSPPGLNESKLNPAAIKATKLSFKIMQFTINSENQNSAVCLKPLRPFILPYLLSYCYYQKNEQVKPGTF
jgi:hypothetical protein